MMRQSRYRQIGWLAVLAACFAAFLALTFKVNALKGEVRLIERQIIAAERAKLMLETEFQTRASQHQLAAWNAVEFGYSAPRADQYVEHERELAALGTPRGMGAPSPIRVARADIDTAEDESLLDGWLADEEPNHLASAASANADAQRPMRAVAGSLAQRLARPTRTTIAVAEIGR